MKVFDFKCNECEHIEERYVRGDDKPKCNKCGGETSKMLSAPRMLQTTSGEKRRLTR